MSQSPDSFDGSTFTDFGPTYQLTWGGYRGDRIGIYAYNLGETGHGHVDSFTYTVA